MNEWAFVGQVATWWDHEFSSHPEWKLDRSEIETPVKMVVGSGRSDIRVVGSGVTYLSGEIRLPDHPMPNPWHPDNLLNAINKAAELGSRWAFTSDCNSLLLIDCSRPGPPVARVVQEIPLVVFQDRAELDSKTFLKKAQLSWVAAIQLIAPIVVGLILPKGLAPDELLVNSLRALLAAPVAAIREELNERRVGDANFADRLVKWMVDEQGWVHVPENWEHEVLRASQLTAYVFGTRLMFYEALRRSKPTLDELGLTSAGASVAQATMKALFEAAEKKSGDYDTLFTWDTACEFALLGDSSVPLWQRVIDHLKTFDVSRIGYDILGKIFERLIDPHERYRWGQHYTNPDVVDLMLSFAIPDGDGKILDPACGGGTFLVRAYARKKSLHPEKTHQQILSELYGADISAFAASLATVNLAVRQLDFVDNYPQITVRSFFQVEPAGTFMTLPSPKRFTLDEAKLPVILDRVRAVVCNPPYVRIHVLGRERQTEAARILGAIGRRIPLPAKLPGLSNYHVYFWMHGAQFLEPNGRLVMIAAGEWLDSDYGATLQKWLLDHFQIECMVESIAEPWFSEARVGTVVVSAKLCQDEASREENQVKFVLLRKPLRWFYGESDSNANHFAKVDSLRDRLIALTAVGESDDFDWSVVTQGDLRKLGTFGKETS